MAQPNRLRQLFIDANRVRVYPKGSSIIVQGGSLEEVFMIAGGMVRVSDYDSNGNQHTVTLLTKNHTFPFAWIFNELPEEGALHYYQTITEVTCYTASMADARGLVDNDPHVARSLLDTLAKSYHNAAARIQNLQKTNVGEKIDFTLYYLAVLLGKATGDIVKLDMPLTHQEIADLAGLSRESVSIQLNKKKYRKLFWKESYSSYINIGLLDVGSMPSVFPTSA